MKWKPLVGVAIILGMAGNLPAGSFLDIRPGLVELSLPPGGRVLKGHFIVSNPTSEPLRFNVKVEDGWPQQVGQPSFLSPEEWFHLKVPEKLVVRPNGEKKIPYRIEVPPQLVGEVLVLVFFSGLPEEGPSPSVGIQFRHGIPVYVSAKGTEKAVLSVKTTSPGFTPEGSLTISAKLGLVGNTHVRPRGEWIVKDFFGQEVERLPLDYGMPIFPGAGRDYVARGKRTGWASGSYRALLSVTYGELWGAPQVFEKQFSLQVTDNKLTLSEAPAHAP